MLIKARFVWLLGIQQLGQRMMAALGIVSVIGVSVVDDEGIDLISMGTHGRTGLERYLIGSVTERPVRTSNVPVLTVK